MAVYTEVFEVGDQLVELNPDDYVDDFQHLPKCCIFCAEDDLHCLCDVPLVK